MNKRMPAMFIGHGSPINAIADNEYSRTWAALGASLQRPVAILCISAHWEATGTYITASEAPPTLHEFHGYPRELHELRYPAPGSIALAERVTQLLAPERVVPDKRRGFDHGAWTVLAPMYPDADIPLVELSLDITKSGAWHFELAKRLRPLRDEGILILGSGNIVHNLAAFESGVKTPEDWASRFNQAVKTMLINREYQGLWDLRHLRGDALRSVPTPEHYLPLLYAIAQQTDDEIRFETDEVFSSMSMTSVIIGG